MTDARIHSIHISPTESGPTHAVDAANLVPRQGVEGDRYFRIDGNAEPKAQLTLIELETIEALAAEHKIKIAPGEARRQIVTEGVRLNDLVDCEFKIGGVYCKGIELCHPCGHLEKLTVEGIRNALKDRGGLRAEILSEGTVHPGDPISI